jgi:hypothetical protein
MRPSVVRRALSVAVRGHERGQRGHRLLGGLLGEPVAGRREERKAKREERSLPGRAQLELTIENQSEALDSAYSYVRMLKKEEPPENAFDRLDEEHRPLWPVKGKDA